ncbi:glycosyltransferase [Leuconostoc mesenteroides]|uniref:glycosyltransferase n=1 Tax=Leuconostoc mesenteroides TaxID=1245 RepID=UPI00101F21F9|nr:glycosyltransferase [Leuconostoc mesenteroides]KAA8366080.1 glycosyltransferase family 1 protein [Leuconostoc mesenteroides]QBC39979.1 glycosyltransferase family 1 protein [Leuconostoc mesenteroides]
MLHILQLPGTLSRSNGRMTVIMNIYREIIKKDIQFDFLVTEVAENDYSEEIRELGGKIFSLPSGKDTLFAVRRKMREVLSNSSYRYDVIHYHAISSWGFAIDIPYREKINVITHSHATQLSDTIPKSLRNRIFTLNIFLYSNQFIACSNEAGGKLFIRSKFIYLPNAINPKPFLYNQKKRVSYRKMLKIEDDELLIGSVGRLAKQKNQQFLIKILDYLIKKGIPAKLLIIGDGIDRKKLIDRASQFNLTDYVRLIGSVRNPSDYYSAMDIFALPSLFEGLPMVGIESQANGLPAVFSSTISKQVNIYNASFIGIEEEDIKKWGETIISSYRQGRDKLALNHIRNSGFDSTFNVQRWIKIYDDCDIL